LDNGACLMSGFNYTAAAAACSASGKRVCTAMEVALLRKSDQCAHTETQMWSSSPCTAVVNTAHYFEGPVELTSTQCLVRTFDVSGGTHSVQGVHLRMRLWLPGEWQVRGRDYDLTLHIGDERVWTLGDKVVCSVAGKNILGEFRGHFPKARFFNARDLSNFTCYVDISHRTVVRSSSLLEVRVCRQGEVRARSTFRLSLSLPKSLPNPRTSS
jgi:hypothetical protein